MKHRQHQVERSLRVVTHDQHRQNVLTQHHERDQRHDEDGNRRRVVNVADARNEDARAHDADPEQKPQRQEQLDWIVEIVAEAIAAPATLGHQPQRQPHQRAEGRLDGTQKHGGASEQEDRKGCHRDEWARGASRSMRPSRRPPGTAQPLLESSHFTGVALVIIAKKV